MTCKLTYFNGRGRGELSRLLFAYSGNKFQDNRIEFPEWPELKPKTPLGSLPLLEVDGKTLVQSLTIARYLANKYGLAGKSDVEKAVADGIVATTEDFRVDLVPVLFEKDDKEKAKKMDEFKGKGLIKLQFFEKKLIENGNGEYFVGKSLTWADLAVYDILFTLVSVNPSALDAYPKLKAHQERIGKNPKVKAYVDSRPKTPF